MVLKDRKRTRFRLKPRFSFDNDAIVLPENPNDATFKTVEELKALLTPEHPITKVSVEVCKPTIGQYLHTFVAIRANDGEVYIFEVSQENFLGLSRWGKAEDLFRAGGVHRIANAFRNGEPIDPYKLLYQFSKVVPKSWWYAPTNFNCDYFATWALTGEMGWETVHNNFNFVVDLLFQSKMLDYYARVAETPVIFASPSINDPHYGDVKAEDLAKVEAKIANSPKYEEIAASIGHQI